jgi:hypothetical protein
MDFLAMMKLVLKNQQSSITEMILSIENVEAQLVESKKKDEHIGELIQENNYLLDRERLRLEKAYAKPEPEVLPVPNEKYGIYRYHNGQIEKIK